MDKRVLIPDSVLAVLIDAASKWGEELDQYIIPSAEETSAEDAEDYRTESVLIEWAVTHARTADKEN